MTYSRVDGSNTTYRVGDFIPQTWRGWDDYGARLARYEILESGKLALRLSMYSTNASSIAGSSSGGT